MTLPGGEVAQVAAPPSTGSPSGQEADRAAAFRPDIQALRAVAVSAVVVYHFWPKAIPGGFVGVDVFFVISGFLITLHLLGELGRTGRIGLTQFWARRIRRLLPAAFVVLAVCILVLLFAMPTVTWQQNFGEIGASAGYVENWLLGFHAIDYLAAANTPSLVQHYWSLSVEEQFYLIWPLLLMLAVFVARHFDRMKARIAIIWMLGAVAVVSLGVSVIGTSSKPALAFFATPTRAWEFAVGGLLSALPHAAWARTSVRGVASWLGLLGIAASCVFINGTSAEFPGWIAIVPVAGALLVLFGGTTSQRWSTARLAVVRPIQWLGGYSYSLYLWHWPLIIAAPYVLHRAPRWSDKLVLVLIALILTYLTKTFAEDPIRTGIWWRARRWRAYTLAVAGMVVLIGLTSMWSAHMDSDHVRDDDAALVKINAGVPCFGADAIIRHDCPDIFARPADLDPAFAAADIDNKLDACQQNVDSRGLILCSFGQQAAPKKTIALVGNSHALRLLPA